MAQKPRIEYIDKYYSYGSEARQIEAAPKKPKTTLPKIKLELAPVRRICIDPVAVVGMLAAVMLLAALVLGCTRFYELTEERDRMDSYVSSLRHKNAELTYNYRSSFDLEEIRVVAERAGMVEPSEAERMFVYVRVPEIPKEPTYWENVRWFLSGLFENARR